MHRSALVIATLFFATLTLSVACDGDSASSGNADTGTFDVGGEPDISAPEDVPSVLDVPDPEDVKDPGDVPSVLDVPEDVPEDVPSVLDVPEDVPEPGDVTACGDCNDDNPCTLDDCDWETGTCVHTVMTGEVCDDGDPCTVDGICSAEGVCEETAIVCDDGVDCTTDTCVQGNCVFEPSHEACDDAEDCSADWCDPVLDCLHTGMVVGGENPLDGAIGDFLPASLIGRNGATSEIPGAELSALHFQALADGLMIGVSGMLPDSSYAWVILLDVDATAPTVTGLTSLADLDPGFDTLLSVAQSAAMWTDEGFGVDLVVGSVGQEILSVSESSSYAGCRVLSADGGASTGPCGVDFSAEENSFEVFVPWTTIPGGLPTGSNAGVVRGFLDIVDAQSGDVVGLRIPDSSDPNEMLLAALAGAPCTDPYCGDYVVDAGEECDDGNDIPDDDCNSCSVPPWAGMVFVPAGSFVMGMDDSPGSEAHVVELSDFYIDRYETTNAEFAAFLNAMGDHATDEGEMLFDCMGANAQIVCSDDGQFTVNEGMEDHPVAETFWLGAHLYCEWVGKRLPTEAEWEKAARGPESTGSTMFYPWGDTFEPTYLNCLENVCGDGYEHTAPIGSYEDNVSYYGAYDMAGNVWEWVYDWYAVDYYTNGATVDPLGPCENGLDPCSIYDSHSVRGGGWDDNAERTMSTYRYSSTGSCNTDIGFRCAKSFQAAQE